MARNLDREEQPRSIRVELFQLQLDAFPDAACSDTGRIEALPDAQHFLFTRLGTGSSATTYLGSLDGSEPRKIAEGSRQFVATLSGEQSSLS